MYLKDQVEQSSTIYHIWGKEKEKEKENPEKYQKLFFLKQKYKKPKSSNWSNALLSSLGKILTLLLFCKRRKTANGIFLFFKNWCFEYVLFSNYKTVTPAKAFRHMYTYKYNIKTQIYSIIKCAVQHKEGEIVRTHIWLTEKPLLGGLWGGWELMKQHRGQVRNNVSVTRTVLKNLNVEINKHTWTQAAIDN